MVIGQIEKAFFKAFWKIRTTFFISGSDSTSFFVGQKIIVLTKSNRKNTKKERLILIDDNIIFIQSIYYLSIHSLILVFAVDASLLIILHALYSTIFTLLWIGAMITPPLTDRAANGFVVGEKFYQAELSHPIPSRVPRIFRHGCPSWCYPEMRQTSHVII